MKNVHDRQNTNKINWWIYMELIINRRRVFEKVNQNCLMSQLKTITTSSFHNWIWHFLKDISSNHKLFLRFANLNEAALYKTSKLVVLLTNIFIFMSVNVETHMIGNRLLNHIAIFFATQRAHTSNRRVLRKKWKDLSNFVSRNSLSIHVV